MITELKIINYKSTLKTTVPLTAFTVLIGENGAGKSNILESLVLAAAASANKLDTEYLTARGVRLCSTRLTTSAFAVDPQLKPITIVITSKNSTDDFPHEYEFILHHDDRAITQWVLDAKSKIPLPMPVKEIIRSWFNEQPTEEVIEAKAEMDQLLKIFSDVLKETRETKPGEKRLFKGPLPALNLKSKLVSSLLNNSVQKSTFERFTVYNPNYETLKNPLAVPSTTPVGPKGEGMLSTLSAMSEDEPERLIDVTESLSLFGWYSAIILPTTTHENPESKIPRLAIFDRYIKAEGISLDDAAVNEGFLFVLFYLTLFCSSKTPEVFGIENIDNALNPRLCEVLVKRLILLGQKYQKQAIVTTHSPAVLDALDLNDHKQSLVIVRRNPQGHTVADGFKKPLADTKNNVRLSEAFLRGHIGALPKGI
jgi:predicted ATPase